ncbi:MAG: glycosyltransferase [Planctomycetaceae bacterium]|jgi:glycosyltransferase involved in cell wall biosynthesis|nr:glycosyltransferase [Planctomycetaceae bacterium]
MPKVSIIVPVYKVENYLRKCLDSIVNQTLRDIEIICVNDGSPDNSPQILEEYAAKDSRITVIHKENGGSSSARNAAYPYIKGEYTLFVDSDDWIEPDLCKKTVAVADSENIDMTFFFRNSILLNSRLYPLEKKVIKCNGKKLDKTTLINFPAAWSKLWRTLFLLNNELKFPEGIIAEDIPVHWKALVCEPRTKFICEKLYHYRLNLNSITNDKTGKKRDIIIVYRLIKEMLLKRGLYYGEWKDLFLQKKLYDFVPCYYGIPKILQPIMLEDIRTDFGEDEYKFFKETNNLPQFITDFYVALNGSQTAKFKCKINSILLTIRKNLFLYKALIQEQLH